MDIVKQLRSDYGIGYETRIEAADEIERLRKTLRSERQDASKTIVGAADEVYRLRKVLQSIANNTCCDKCQEAALVARAAFKEKE